MKKIDVQIDYETLDDEEMKEIKKALEEVKLGNVKPIEQVAKELGIILKNLV